MTRSIDLATGKIVRFEYPAHNFHGVRSNREIRRIRIDRVRSLDDEPLHPSTSELQPLLRRGTQLVIGLDLDKAATRAFYLESMAEIEEIGPDEILPDGTHVMAVFDPKNPGDAPEEVYRGPADACLRWAKTWLCGPNGFGVSIEPPREKSA